MQTRGIISLVLIGAAVLFGASVALGSFYTIDEQERGVLLRNGKTVKVVTPGLSFKYPFIEDVIKIPVRTFTYTWGGDKDRMEAYSYDQQPAFVKVSVTLSASPDKVDKLYAIYGTLGAAVQNRLSPIVNERLKIVFGQYTALRAVQNREKLNLDVAEEIKSQFNDDTITLHRVQIENIEFQKSYMESIEQRMQAEVEVQRIRQNLEREKVTAEITVTKAKAAADSLLAQRKAEADGIRLVGEAQAAAIRSRAEALAQNQNLVLLTQAERWDGKLPSTMLPNSGVPMLSLPAQK